ncbi:MAG: hypothetical protein FVQ80_18150 [Planctomycetes bacterium]|nr:hypothetical protein [Planctomycetota bacterium]
MNPVDIRDYKARWKRVNRFEKNEQFSSSPLKRFKQISALMFLTRSLGWKNDDSSSEIAAVRQRWNVLRQSGQ